MKEASSCIDSGGEVRVLHGPRDPLVVNTVVAEVPADNRIEGTDYVAEEEVDGFPGSSSRGQAGTDQVGAHVRAAYCEPRV